MDTRIEQSAEYDTIIELAPNSTLDIALDDYEDSDVVRVTHIDDGSTYKIVASRPIDFYTYAPASESQTDWLDLREQAINELMKSRFDSVGQAPDSVGWTAMGYDFSTDYDGELTVDKAVEIGQQSLAGIENALRHGSFSETFALWISERVFADAAAYEARALSSHDIRGAAYAAITADADHQVADKVARAIAMAAAGAGRPAITKLATSGYVAYADLIGELDVAKADVQNWDEANELIALGQWATAQHTNLEGN